MENFLISRISELSGKSEIQSLLETFAHRLEVHQSHVKQLVRSELLHNPEVGVRVLVGLGAQRTVEGNFFPGILEGLLGGLGLNRPTEGNLPASSRQGVARIWAAVVQSSTELTGPRDVGFKPAEGIPRGLHLDYEDDFLQCQVSEIPQVFSDPKSLLHLASSVFSLAGPPARRVLAPIADPVVAPALAPPEEQVSQDKPMLILLDDDSPQPCQALSPAAVKEEDESDSDADTTHQPASEDQPMEPIPQSDRVLRKSVRHTAREPREDAPPAKRTAVDSDLNQSRGSSPSTLPDGVLCEHRFRIYEKDNKNVHKVRAKILGLSEESRPSQEAIDSLPIFTLRRAADETKAPEIIGEHWIPYLREMGLLADCPPRDLPPLEGRLPLYTRAGILEHVGVGQVLKKEKSCPLIAIVLPEEDFDEERAPIISQLHKLECLDRTSIYGDTNTQKQITFCPYCGVMNENTSTAHSHARKHLGMVYFCGGCYAKIYKRPQAMHLHRQTCEPTVAHWKEKDYQGQDLPHTA